jgi:hypothetical protein
MNYGIIELDNDIIVHVISMIFWWSNKLFCSCDRNSDFFRDVVLMEVSELDGIVTIVRIIVKSVCKQFGSCSCAFNIRIWCRLIHWLLSKDFEQGIQWIRDFSFCLWLIRIQDQDLCWSWSCWWWYLCWFRILKLVSRTRLLRWFKWVRWYCSSVASFEDQVC